VPYSTAKKEKDGRLFGSGRGIQGNENLLFLSRENKITPRYFACTLFHPNRGGVEVFNRFQPETEPEKISYRRSGMVLPQNGDGALIA